MKIFYNYVSISKLCEEEYLWRKIGERDFPGYISLFTNFTVENRWRDLVYHLAKGKLIPLYEYRTIIGEVLIFPTDTVADLDNFLDRISTKGFSSSIILLKNIGKSIPVNFHAGIAIFSTPMFQIMLTIGDTRNQLIYQKSTYTTSLEQ